MQSTMKYIVKTILLLAISSSLVGCNKWLDIIPEDTTTEKQLFSDAGGYHSAINGLYQTMASSSLYGENLTWGFMSALSQYYDNESTSYQFNFSHTEKYEYDSDEVKAYGEQIWQTAYNVIANANNILQNLASADPAIFPEYDKGEVDVIRGEALAVRALMHFELLRLFAVAPSVDAGAKAIPYVETFPSMFNERKTVAEVLTLVKRDFEEAATLMIKNDTEISRDYMSSTQNRYLVSNNSRDYFFTGRGARLNYVAIRSLLARVNAYAGDMEAAYTIAGDIIQKYVVDDNWYYYTTAGFSSGDTETSRPHKLLDELLVSVYNENLVSDYEAMVLSGYDTESYRIKNISGIFADNDDYRKVKLIQTLKLDWSISLKYREREATALNAMTVDAENRVLPVMRLSELYLIMAEYLAANSQMEEAVKILNDLRVKRGCMSNAIDTAVTKADFDKALNLEIWRENVAEGQYFFYCKRINALSINDNGVYVNMTGKYTMNIPDSEISLN